MKRWFPFVVFAVSGTFSLSANTVQEVYARGVRAYIGGNIDAAQALFAEVLAADPSNKSAEIYLQRINSMKPANAEIRKQMDSLIVSKISFKDTSLSTVLDYLPKLAAKESGGKVTLNLVRMFPSQLGEQKTITLELSGVPMSSVLDYVSQAAGMKLDYQAHAIVVSVPTAGDRATVQPAAQ